MLAPYEAISFARADYACHRLGNRWMSGPSRAAGFARPTKSPRRLGIQSAESLSRRRKPGSFQGGPQQGRRRWMGTGVGDSIGPYRKQLQWLSDSTWDLQADEALILVAGGLIQPVPQSWAGYMARRISG